MSVTLSYPDSRKQDQGFDTASEAIEEAYKEADEYTVEVRDGDTLLVRYEKRDEPVYAQAQAAQAEEPDE